MILCNSNRSLEREIDYTKLLISKQVDGILFVGAWIGNYYDHLNEAVKRGIPVVIVDRFAPEMELDQVITDNDLGGWLATSHLISLGHKDIACIAGKPQYTPNAERLNGYMRALSEKNFEINPI